MKARLKFAVLIAGIMGIALIGLEILARVWEAQNVLMDMNGFVRANPVPYMQAPYWSEAFWQERIHLSDNFNGNFYHFDKGVRRTTFLPDHAKHHLYFLGSSTVANDEVPDEWTVASQLQYLLGNDYTVVNLGALGSTDKSMLERLKKIQLQPGDQVIFYESFNEFSVLYFADQRTMDLGLCTHLQFGRIALLRLTCRWTKTAESPKLAELPTLHRTSQEISAIVEQARQLTRAAGSDFMYVIPPLLATHDKLTPYQNEAFNNPNVMYPGLFNLHRRLLPIFRTYVEHLNPVDLSYSLNQAGDVFFDQSHINGKGNAIVAALIYKKIKFEM